MSILSKAIFKHAQGKRILKQAFHVRVKILLLIFNRSFLTQSLGGKMNFLQMLFRCLRLCQVVKFFESCYNTYTYLGLCYRIYYLIKENTDGAAGTKT